MDLETLETGLRRAVGRRKVTEDYVAASLVERLAVTLDCDSPTPRIGEALPPGWHTIFCLQAPPRAELGDDGLPRQYDLIPPVAMQRRLFGGARLEFHGRLVVGEPVRCESELSETKVRSTATAHLAIATLRHRFFGPAGLAVVEEQDIIHMEAWRRQRENPGAREGRPSPTWQRAITPDALTLFRFSAMTFNSHRIHYDAPYAENVEKLPGLVVQGKLIALQLLETMRRAAPDADLTHFAYRSAQPLYAGRRCTLAVKLGDGGNDARLWAEDEAGAVCADWLAHPRQASPWLTAKGGCDAPDRACRAGPAGHAGASRAGPAGAGTGAYPNRPIRLVVPYPAGGTADAMARALGQELMVAWGQPVVVENRPGASTIIGAEFVARSAPDGYTLLFTTDSTLTINPMLHKQLSYQPQKDFAPITVIGYQDLVLVVHPSVPARTLEEFVALAKAKPGTLNYGSFGNGSPAASRHGDVQSARRHIAPACSIQGHRPGLDRSPERHRADGVCRRVRCRADPRRQGARPRHGRRSTLAAVRRRPDLRGERLPANVRARLVGHCRAGRHTR
jgi:3-methylfumaryl-CoA hydratase